MKLYDFFAMRSKWEYLVLGFLLSLFIGCLDYLTGIELGFSIFYLFPITLATWFSGERAGLLLALTSGMTWLIADIMAGHVVSHPLILYWNASIRLAFFILIVIILSRLKKELDSKTQIIVKLQNALSELKRTEEELEKKAAELVRSNNELERFAYSAAHDLKEPLLSMGGFIRLLQRRYRDRLDADAQKLISSAIAGSMRMEALISGLLSYAGVGAKDSELTPADSTAVLESACTNLQALIEENKAVIRYDHLPTVTADTVLLGQLFQNLIANAVKFKRAEPPEIHISAKRSSNNWVFSVRDNGMGIDRQHFDRIFEMFHRLPTKTKHPGSGIGLALCKKIVERHGGQIWVESEPGEGSTFYFTLPVMPQPENGAAGAMKIPDPDHDTDQ